MRSLCSRLGIAALFLSMAFGQSSDRVLSFTQANTAQGYQEIGDTVRSVAEVQGSVDAERKTLSASGAPDNLAAAAWLFSQLDAGAGPREYKMTAPRDNVLRVFRLENMKTPTDLQETVNAARSVLEVNRMFPVSGRNLIAVRASAERIAALEWLLGQLDRPAGNRPDPLFQHYKLTDAPEGRDNTLAVLFLNQSDTPQQLQETANVTRSLVEINRLFPSAANRAIAVASSETQVAALEWMVRQIESPGASGQPAEYRIPQGGAWPKPGQNENVIRLLPLANARTPQEILALCNSLRTATKANRLFPVKQMVAFRGNESQAAQAEFLVKQFDAPGAPPND
jgi:hypothetical protein